MASLEDILKQAEAQGIDLSARGGLPPEGSYVLTLAGAKAGASSKAKAPQITLTWKTTDNRTFFQNMSFSGGASAYSLANAMQLGVARSFFATTAELTPLAAEIERVAKGAAFNIVVKHKSNEKGTNANFFNNGRAAALPQAPTFAPQIGVAAAPVPQQPVPAPVPVAPVALPVIPVQPVSLDPLTGLPPRPGI